ncbi:hypothetical protein ZOSMA_29G00590 [Zostera marina]|uniref:Uncharacterized protein n=1 Tax=Zostera marina TaxID=29655 RepID=A0A0K9PDV2_ZOSMR|nr:hypothetical protein ZOSMA_29G00590 [Zostera marina]
MGRWNEKSPALKILWFWTFATAAALVTRVMTTRITEMKKFLEEQNLDQPSSSSSTAVDDTEFAPDVQVQVPIED